MIIQADNPNIFNALNVVASAISSGVLFKYAAIISTVTGKLQGSFLWKVQYRCKNILDLKKKKITFPTQIIDLKSQKKFLLYLSVMASLTFWGSLDARVFGYMKGASVSTRSLSRGMTLSWRIFLTPFSDLSFHRYPVT